MKLKLVEGHLSPSGKDTQGKRWPLLRYYTSSTDNSSLLNITRTIYELFVSHFMPEAHIWPRKRSTEFGFLCQVVIIDLLPSLLFMTLVNLSIPLGKQNLPNIKHNARSQESKELKFSPNTEIGNYQAHSTTVL